MKSFCRSSVSCALVLGAVLVRVPLSGQEGPTIPEALAQAGKSLSGHQTVPSGLPPSIDDILAETDTVVRGVVGEPRSYLSTDKREVYTDYPVRDLVFLYHAGLYTTPGPTRASIVLVTVLGGTVNVGAYSYTFEAMALPPLTPGTECLFLLKRADDKYRVAGRYYGVFQLAHGKTSPLSKKQGFAPEFQDAPASTVIQEVVSRLRARPN